MDIFFIQILLGISLFFLINWIGKHSYSIGYMEISIFVKSEDAPALNFLIRVLTPIVYIIIVSAILYYYQFDKFVTNIYLVNVYYILFRLIFNLVTKRGLLINWYRQFLYWSSIVIVSFFAYEKIIKVKTNILPDFTTISNELWIIILIFIFHVVNNLRFSQDASQQRKFKYLISRYNHFEKLYGEYIKKLTQNEILECIVYAIIIYEDFNRPKIARYVEALRFRMSKSPHTLGVMQVKSSKLITDLESVELGVNKIVNAYENYLESQIEMETSDYDWSAKSYIINDYNGGTNYNEEVIDLADIIKDIFYSNTKDTLFDRDKPRGQLKSHDNANIIKVMPQFDDNVQINEIDVDNVEDFIFSLKSNTTIRLKEGKYNFSDITKYNTNPNVRWKLDFKDYEPHFNNFQNLTIIGEKNVELLINSSFAWVMQFNKCINIEIKNLTAGHTTPGSCTGGVFMFNECKRIKILNCDLYGCGTYGLTFNKCSEGKINKTIVRDCTYGIAQFFNTNKINFKECSFFNCKEFDLLTVFEYCEDISFLSCIFKNNYISRDERFFINTDRTCKNIAIESSEIVRNKVMKWSNEPEVIVTRNNEYGMNNFESPQDRWHIDDKE